MTRKNRSRNVDPAMIAGLVQALAPVAKGALSAIAQRRKTRR